MPASTASDFPPVAHPAAVPVEITRKVPTSS